MSAVQGRGDFRLHRVSTQRDAKTGKVYAQTVNTVVDGEERRAELHKEEDEVFELGKHDGGRWVRKEVGGEGGW